MKKISGSPLFPAKQMQLLYQYFSDIVPALDLFQFKIKMNYLIVFIGPIECFKKFMLVTRAC